MGSYLSQDPIGLAGGNPTLYGYVFDTNIGVDVLGLNVFWSGRSAAFNTAKEFASKNVGRTILETTPKGMALSDLTKNMEWIEAKPLWDKASADFAEQAVLDFRTGKITHVDIFINDAHYAGKTSVWESVEKPILEANKVPIKEHHIKCY